MKDWNEKDFNQKKKVKKVTRSNQNYGIKNTEKLIGLEEHDVFKKILDFDLILKHLIDDSNAKTKVLAAKLEQKRKKMIL